MWLKIKEVDLHYVSFTPEDYTKQYTDNDSHEEPDCIVPRVSPIRPMLFPEASLALSYEALGIFCRKIKILGLFLWSA